MELITVYLKRVKQPSGGFTTEVYKDKEGTQIKALYPVYQRQPSRRAKTIMLNCARFAVEFIN